MGRVAAGSSAFHGCLAPAPRMERPGAGEGGGSLCMYILNLCHFAVPAAIPIFVRIFGVGGQSTPFILFSLRQRCCRVAEKGGGGRPPLPSRGDVDQLRRSGAGRGGAVALPPWPAMSSSRGARVAGGSRRRGSSHYGRSERVFAGCRPVQAFQSQRPGEMGLRLLHGV